MLCVECVQDLGREKKQAKVKPMSASEERMMEDAITLANEVTATRAQRHSASQSPPHSPTGSSSDRMDYPDGAEHSQSPSLISKLKNSIRRSPKSERKRTFSDGRSKEEESVPVSAMEAYNALVDRKSQESDSVFDAPEPYRESQPEPQQASPLPQRGPSVTSPPRAGLPQPPPRPMPKPRLPDPALAVAKSEPPVPKPRPEIVQRVEPTIRRPPDSPEAPPSFKDVKEAPVISTVGSSSSHKESQREQLKRTIEIVRLDPPQVPDQPASPVGDSQPDTKESTPEPDSDSTWRSSASEGAESSSPKVATSLFEEDLPEPSPREIMSKLARESRMRRNLDHQRVLTGESTDPQAASMARSSRSGQPSGIPVKAAPLAGGEEDEKDDDDEVDTNPLRMLRGGAIPIRSSRGAGNSSSAAKGAQLASSSSLRYPKFGFQSRSVSVGGDAAPKLPPRSNSVCSDSERASSRLPVSVCEGEGGGGGDEAAPPPTPPPPPPPRTQKTI
jgi:hypothetical protein